MAAAHARHASPLERLLLSEAFDGEALVREPMARHTSYRIGGPADLFVRADSLCAAGLRGSGRAMHGGGARHEPFGV